jgi:hypothetical protein
MILTNFTILTALVATRDVRDCAANFPKLYVLVLHYHDDLLARIHQGSDQIYIQ